MSWSGVPNDRPLLPSKDKGSVGGKVNFNVKCDAGKSLGTKGSGAGNGTATKADKKALNLGQGSVTNTSVHKKTSYGPAPNGGRTKP